jgi:riboflavin kinase / FMN adenylyltransferase
MNIIHVAKELKTAGRKVCLAIGFFDGVHLGHQQIIRQTIADARQHDALALVLTFDRHPNSVVAPDHVPPLIYSLPQKLCALESLGADTLLVIHFDETFSRQTGEEFIRSLARDVGQIQSLCVGADFVFGHRRSGNVSLLKKLGTEISFHVHGLAAVSLDNQIVSSTRIRELIHAGELDTVSQMLGRPYAISSRVIHGEHLGKNMGFPTANLDPAGLALPPNGVYAAFAYVKGRVYRAAINIGFRPTVARESQVIHLEAHLLDFSDNVYGEEVEVQIVEKLREERKFSSKSELQAQIARDIATLTARLK